MAKKIKRTKAERAYKEMRSYVNDKIKLFGTCTSLGSGDEVTSRSKNMLEILEEMKRVMDRA